MGGKESKEDLETFTAAKHCIARKAWKRVRSQKGLCEIWVHSAITLCYKPNVFANSGISDPRTAAKSEFISKASFSEKMRFATGSIIG